MAEARDRMEADRDSIFRRHFNEHYEETDYPYERYEVAYVYGYDLARPEQADKWIGVQEEARRGWEERQAGAWEDFKDAIEYAWTEAKDAMSG